VAWESRKRGGRYYYRSQRVGGRVQKVYAGGGTIGELAAEADRIERERREAEALLVKQERERLEALVSPILELSEAAEILAEAHLVASGFRRVGGHWRQRRESN
jgi:hypothetical protein